MKHKHLGIYLLDLVDSVIPGCYCRFLLSKVQIKYCSMRLECYVSNFTTSCSYCWVYFTTINRDDCCTRYIPPPHTHTQVSPILTLHQIFQCEEIKNDDTGVACVA
jgi:hypothetical protein